MYEYKVVPAPVRGLKTKIAKTPEDRFATALQTVMNDHARNGWEYLRADTLPCEQRDGLVSKVTVFQNMLIFRREMADTIAMPDDPPPPAQEKAEAPLPQEQQDSDASQPEDAAMAETTKDH